MRENILDKDAFVARMGDEVIDRMRLCDASVQGPTEVESLSLSLLEALHGEAFIKDHVAGVAIIDDHTSQVRPYPVDEGSGKFMILVSRSLLDRVSDEAELAAAFSATACFIERLEKAGWDTENKMILQYAAAVDSVHVLAEKGYDPQAVRTYWEKVQSDSDHLKKISDYMHRGDPQDMARLAGDACVALANKQKLPESRPELSSSFYKLKEYEHRSRTDRFFDQHSFKDAPLEQQFELLLHYYENEFAAASIDEDGAVHSTSRYDYCEYVDATCMQYDAENKQHREAMYRFVDGLRRAHKQSKNPEIGQIFSTVHRSVADVAGEAPGKEKLLFRALESFSGATNPDVILSKAKEIEALLQDEAVLRGIAPTGNPWYAREAPHAIQGAIRYPGLRSFLQSDPGERFKHSLDAHVILAEKLQSRSLTSVLLRLGLSVDPRVASLQEELEIGELTPLRRDDDAPRGSQLQALLFAEDGSILGLRAALQEEEASQRRIYACSRKTRVSTSEETDQIREENRQYSEALIEEGEALVDEVPWHELREDFEGFVDGYKEYLLIPRVTEASHHPFAERFSKEVKQALAEGNEEVARGIKNFFFNDSAASCEHLIQYPGVLGHQESYDPERLKESIDFVRKHLGPLGNIAELAYRFDPVVYQKAHELGLHHLTMAERLDSAYGGASVSADHPYVSLLLDAEVFSPAEKERALSRLLDGFTRQKHGATAAEELQRFDFRKLGYELAATPDEMAGFIAKDSSSKKALARYELIQYLGSEDASVNPSMLVVASDLSVEFETDYFGTPQDVSPFGPLLRACVTDRIAQEKEALIAGQRSVLETIDSYVVYREHGILNHEEAKNIEVQLEDRIAALVPQEQTQALEALLFARNESRYESVHDARAPYTLHYTGFVEAPEFREFLFERYASLLIEEFGVDDGSSAYVDSYKKRLETLLKKLPEGSAFEVMNRVAPAIEAQRGLCSIIRDRFATDNYAVLEASNLHVRAGKLLISHLTRNEQSIDETVSFLQQELTEQSLEQYYRSCFQSSYDALGSFCPSAALGLKRALKVDRFEEIKGQLEMFHQNFWKMSPEAQAVFMDKIILPVSLSPDERREQMTKNIQQGLSHALPESMEHHAIVREMAQVFLEELDEDSCRLMTAMAYASQNPYESQKRLGEVLSRVLSVGLDVAGDKLLQGIHSAAEVPQEIKDDIAKSKVNASPVPHWEVVHWIDERGPGSNLTRVVGILGSGASAVTVHVHDDKGSLALKVLRPEASYRGDRHFGRAENAAERLRTMHKRYKALPDVIAESRRSFSIEVATEHTEVQHHHAELCYQDTEVHVGTRRYQFPVANLRAPGSASAIGKEYTAFELAEGEHFNDRVEQKDDQIQDDAMAHATMELYNKLRGLASCTDRHGGQQKLIGDQEVASTQLDIAAFELTKPTEEMLAALGTVIDASVSRLSRAEVGSRVLAFVGLQRFAPETDFAKVFSEECDRLITKSSPEIQSYLHGMKRSFLANGDFFNQLDAVQLEACIKAVFDTGEVHPAIQKQFGFLTNRWLQGVLSKDFECNVQIVSTASAQAREAS